MKKDSGKLSQRLLITNKMCVRVCGGSICDNFSHHLVKSHRTVNSEVTAAKITTTKNAAIFRNWIPIKVR